MTGKCMVWLVTTSVVRTEGGVNRMSHLACHPVTEECSHNQLTIITTTLTQPQPVSTRPRPTGHQREQIERFSSMVELELELELEIVLWCVGDVTAGC